jgi:hypothetical protein
LPNLVDIYKARGTDERQKNRLQRDIQNPLGAFILDLSGKSIS